jgi:hypothetical protein
MPDKAASRALHTNDQPHRDIERFNARLRHFRGVAASVLNDAQKTWMEIVDACRDSRSCEEIIEGIDESGGALPSCGWPEFREKLHLLGHYIDYTKRLCDGSLDDLASGKREV